MLVKFFIPLVGLLISTSLFSLEVDTTLTDILEKAVENDRINRINQEKQLAKIKEESEAIMKKWHNSLISFDAEIAAKILKRDHGLEFNYNLKSDDIKTESFVCTVKADFQSDFYKKLKLQDSSFLDEKKIYLTKTNIYLEEFPSGFSNGSYLGTAYKNTNINIYYSSSSNLIIFKLNDTLLIYKYQNLDGSFELINYLSYKCLAPSGLDGIKMQAKLKMMEMNGQ